MHFGRLFKKLLGSVEQEQAVVRLGFATAISGYVLAHPFLTGQVSQYFSTGIVVSVSFWLFSLALLGWITLEPAVRRARRIVGIVADIGALSFAMSTTGMLAAPLFPVYLWVSFGNGFRFGVPYLYLSASLSLIGFVVAITQSEYWRQSPEVAAGVLLALVILPTYVASLLRRINAERRRAEEASSHKSQVPLPDEP